MPAGIRMMHKGSFGKTKIVCTLGPACNTPQIIGGLIKAGMDVARLNFSHGTYSEHVRTLRQIRAGAKAAGEPICIIQDLQGPKIRIGELKTPSVELKTGSRVTITTRPVIGDAETLSTTYHHLAKDVKKGDRILLDDGKIELKVLSSIKHDVLFRIVTGGMLTAHKGINLPGIAVSAPSV